MSAETPRSAGPRSAAADTKLWRRFFREVGDVFKRRAVVALLALVPVLAVVWFLRPIDHRLDAWLRLNQQENWLVIGRAASRYGELHFAPLLALIVIGAIGYFAKRREMIWAAVAGLCAGAVGGLTVNILKIFVGRPRPSTPIPDGVYPFHFGWDYASFPSGHATHCTAITVAVAMLAPRSGFLCACGAALVMWSRWYLERHYPSDIWAGACLGATIGLLFGTAAKRVLRQQR
ncbi:MAG TPA: phosphatase PAP2 family protein [Opitutaceae bacterium]|nr:phosphatase PAP2 family protein [Opitutaceae bacterium]